MEYKDLLKALADHLGGAVELDPDESGTVVLGVDDMRVSIVGMDEVSTVAFSAVVGHPPPEDRIERLYKALLEANHLFVGTGGATFSVNSETGEISLCRAMRYAALDGESFCEALTSFVNTLEAWVKLVADFRGAELPASGAASASGGKADDAAMPSFGLGSFMSV